MIRSLFSSSSGLRAHQELLDVIGNNLANANTTGYKSQRLRFSNQFTQLLAEQSAPSGDVGGKNPVEIGLGVQVAAVDTRFAQGNFENTGNKLDLAIQNDGFFVLKNNEMKFTRAGAFAVDSNNNLVDPATGYKVQRTGTIGEGTATAPAFQVNNVNDIKIPKGITIPGYATQNISFRGNLDANASPPLTEVMTSAQPLTVGGVAAVSSTRLNDLDQTTAAYVAGDQIEITGTRVDGTAVSAIFTATGTASDTVGSLLNVINPAFLSATPGIGATSSLDSSGRIVLAANQPGAASLTLDLRSQPLDPTPASGLTTFSNFLLTVDGKDGDTATTAIEVFDAQFAPHNLTFSFRKVAANQWELTGGLDSAGGTITGFGNDNTVTGLTFNENGSLRSVGGSGAAQVVVSLNPLTVGGVPATLATTLDTLDRHTGGAYVAGDQVLISGTDNNGQAIGPVTLPAAGKTVGDLVSAITSGFNGATAALDASGSIILTANSAGQSQLSLRLDDAPTNVGGPTSFGGFSEAIRGTDGDSNMTFEINGLQGFGNKQTINLAFGSTNGFNGLTQFGGFTSAASTDQDGFSQGTLGEVSVERDGVIMGQFSNGRSEAIAQIALATFINPEGLSRAANNFFDATANSGAPIITAPSSGAAGFIQSGVLESSNVDVGVEFTQLIAAQRGYQVNARAFSLANQIMEETSNLLR
ncbi:MAG: flagellar hook-basal body complex protein [Planctomycetales bacterium]|nr:flagellar hook-basal body complex protein [Planctomycetales bacterium]